MTAKCEAVSPELGSGLEERDIGGKNVNPDKVWSLVNSNVPVRVS